MTVTECTDSSFSIVEYHSASEIPSYNIADWTEFTDIVYNHDNSVEVARITKFGSPKFQFSPFKTMEEQRDDPAEKHSSPLLKDPVWISEVLNETEKREHMNEEDFFAMQYQKQTLDIHGMNTATDAIDQNCLGLMPSQFSPSMSKQNDKSSHERRSKTHPNSHSHRKKNGKSHGSTHRGQSHGSPKKKNNKQSTSPIKEGIVTNKSMKNDVDGNTVLLSAEKVYKQRKEIGMKQPKDDSASKDDRSSHRRPFNSSKSSFESIPSPKSDRHHEKKTSRKSSLGKSLREGEEKKKSSNEPRSANQSDLQFQQSQAPKRHSTPSVENKLDTVRFSHVSKSLADGGPPSTTASVTNSSSSIQRFIPSKGMATRRLITASVYHNKATGLWITTINTNQYHQNVNTANASKYLKAFSFHSEREAREAAYSYAPPKMWPSDTQTTCFSCDTSFSMFKRPSHCRNCGACVCNSCFVGWNKLMVPETYNTNDDSVVKICKSCDMLSRLFRQALLEGNYEDVISIYNTGNVNLRCPFMNVKGTEVFYPVHCAILGGNLDIIVWLIDVHFCPIKVFRTTGNKFSEQGSEEQLIATSKGRNVLDIALECKNIDILRYLICDKNISVFGVKDISSILGAFDVAMKALGPLRDDGCYMDEYEYSDDNSATILTSVSDVA